MLLWYLYKGTKNKRNGKMIVANLVDLASKMMKVLSDYGIKMDDYRYLKLYEDYDKLLKDKEKSTYIIIFLRDKYNVPERTIYRILSRFKKPVKT